jgi:hypothetical protein
MNARHAALGAMFRPITPADLTLATANIDAANHAAAYPFSMGRISNSIHHGYKFMA